MNYDNDVVYVIDYDNGVDYANDYGIGVGYVNDYGVGEMIYDHFECTEKHLKNKKKRTIFENDICDKEIYGVPM